MGEYVAAARAIVTEPLNCLLPGDFSEGSNYLSFKNIEELIDAITRLREDDNLLISMMKRNFLYYHTHVRPDSMALNVLKSVLNRNSLSCTTLNNQYILS